MANTATIEERHQQSVVPLLIKATNRGWTHEIIEHDGVRQYKLTHRPEIDGDYCATSISAYFFQEEKDITAWRFVVGFRHGNMDAPLRLKQLVEIVEQHDEVREGVEA